MQMCITFAEALVRSRPHLFPTQDSIGHAVFTRHGGPYFGTAHLLE